MKPRPIPRNLIEQGIGIPMVFNPPEGSEDSIGDLHCLFLEDVRAQLQGRPPEKHRFISWWEPDDDERRRIMAGAPIRLTILGAREINPISLDVGAGLQGILFSPDSNGG